ncbi:mannose-binding protein C-like [Oratosquilla oratoria]
MCPDDYNGTAVVDGTDNIRFCPDGWIGDPVRAMCYFMSTKKNKKNATASKEMCEDMGGEIITPQSVHENFFIRKMLKYDVWVGVWDYVTNGVFEPMDTNRKLNYTHWAEGEPKDRNGVDCTLITKNGTWYTRDCFRKMNFVCTKPGNGTLLADLEDLEGVTIPPGSNSNTSPGLYTGTIASLLPQFENATEAPN